MEEGSKDFKLMEDLEAGKYDTSGNAKNEKFLNERYSRFKKKKEKIDRSNKNKVYKMLSMTLS